MKKTYFQVLETLQEIALSGVSECFIGDAFEIESVARKYPLMVIDPHLKNHTYQNGLFKLRADIYVVDITFEDESNELEVLSNMTGLMIQFINYLRDKDEEYGFYIRKNISTQFNLQTFTEKWDDKVSGVKVELFIDIPDDGNNCKTYFV